MRRSALVGVLGGWIVAASNAGAQSTEIDYVMIDRLDQTFVGTLPVGSHDWTLPGGGCLSVTGPGFHGSNPTRYTDQLVANGYNNGPNGVKEWGAGDDVSVGPVPATWAVATTANEAHAGQFCLTDSPTGFYQTNRNISATIGQVFGLTGRHRVNLVFFHHWENTYSGGGTSFVEVRQDGGAWVLAKQYRFVGGWHGAYREESIDLSAYVGHNIEVRFRMQTGTSQTGDGWYVDDIRLLADGEVFFTEDFETGTDGWTLEAPWGLIGNVTDTPYLSGDTMSKDRFGNLLCTVDATGLVKANPVTVPTATRQGMGYSWVTATFGAHTDGVMLYNGAPEYVQE